MKTKLQLIIVTLFFVPLFSFTQVKAGFGIGGGIPSGSLNDISNFGFGGHLEAKYTVVEQIDVGLLVGWYGFFGGDFSGAGASVDVSGTRIVPITLTGDYVLPGGVYMGLGIGPYLVNFGEIDVSAGGASASASLGKETKFGFAPRVGFNPGSFNVSLAYHLVPDASFLGINIGMLVGF